MRALNYTRPIQNTSGFANGQDPSLWSDDDEQDFIDHQLAMAEAVYGEDDDE